MFQTDKLFILDSMALAHRCFYNNPENIAEETRKFIKDIITRYDPTYLVIATESKSKTFRHQMYSDYKANRPAKDDNFVNSLPDFFGVFSSLGLGVISVEGYEADDVIGTLTTKYASDDLHCVIISNDKDFVQLINPNVSLLKYNNGFNMVDNEKANQLFDFDRKYLLDYMSLVGDTADNIKGASGIGPAKATALIKRFGDIDQIYSYIGMINEPIYDLKPAIIESLNKSINSVRLSKELVTIKKDLDICIDLDEYRVWLDKLNGVKK